MDKTSFSLASVVPAPVENDESFRNNVADATTNPDEYGEDIFIQ